MADSAAICLYLADRYPTKALAPAVDDVRRGAYLFWMLFAPGALEPAVHEQLSGGTPNPAGTGWGNFELTMTTLEQGLEPGPWLLGIRRCNRSLENGPGEIRGHRLGDKPRLTN